jgi:HTH-type transcriptional repressor of NAD biosynthesis genes
MSKAFVLLTALPPTKGHLRLAQFAEGLGMITTVIVSTQPDEPFPRERFLALRNALPNSWVVHYNQTIEQNPEAPGFWDTWHDIYKDFGFEPGDYIVASEPYGQRLADEFGGVFMPYDIDRELCNIRGRLIRSNTLRDFDEIIPEFQKYLRKTVTVFGAESTGKTTLSKMLAKDMNGHWLFEYARPYLEKTVNEITTRSMTGIWKGQAALQQSADYLVDKPFVVQDTDLFSTVGYWDFWDMNTPAGLVDDAIAMKSDLYLITQSNIPFEEDPLRYGGDKRESDDQYWIDLCKKYGLNYRVINAKSYEGRLDEATAHMLECFNPDVLRYERKFND